MQCDVTLSIRWVGSDLRFVKSNWFLPALEFSNLKKTRVVRNKCGVLDRNHKN